MRLTPSVLALAALLLGAAPLFAAAPVGDVLPEPTGAVVDYSVVQGIFNRRCNMCHEGEAAPLGLVLTEIRSYATIVNESSTQAPSLKLIKPKNAAASYIFQKVNSTPSGGQRMPIGTILPVEEQVAIRDWINQGALPANRNPQLLSGPTVTPGAPRAGETVLFALTASDPDEDALTITWDFGDGTTAPGASVRHKFATPGTFTVTASIQDARGGMRQEILTLTVVPDADTDGDGLFDLLDDDDDSDGFTDALEIAAGSVPDAAVVTPVNNLPAVTAALLISSLGAKLNFKKPGTDAFSAKFTLALPAGFSAASQPLVFAAGGLARAVTLDAKGSGPRGNDAFKLGVRASKTGPGSDGQLSVKIKNADAAIPLLGDILAFNPDASTSVPLRCDVLLNQTLFTATPPALYTRKKGGSGKLALPK